MPCTIQYTCNAAPPRKLIDYTQRGKILTQDKYSKVLQNRRRSSVDASIQALFNGSCSREPRNARSSITSIPPFLEISGNALDAAPGDEAGAAEGGQEGIAEVPTVVASNKEGAETPHQVKPNSSSTKHSFLQSVLWDLPLTRRQGKRSRVKVQKGIRDRNRS